MKLIKGKTLLEKHPHLSPDLEQMGYILACQVEVIDDLEIEIPDFSRQLKPKVLLMSNNTQDGKEKNILNGFEPNPLSNKLYLSLDEPDINGQISDLERLRINLAREHGLDKVRISLDSLRQLSDCLREGSWGITITLAYADDGYQDIILVEKGKSSKPAYGISIDIGTTTVVAGLINLEAGKVIDSVGSYNKQSKYGSDVISRINHADETPEGLQELHEAIVDTINSLIEELLEKHSLETRDICAITAAGNTIMVHFLLKITATYLRLEPYIPGAIKFPVFRANQIGIKANPDSPVFILPCVASYVGGDITAGVMATGIRGSDKLTLFIDIGTNGELVLGNRDWMVTCSCSAGPAFEGSGISCGMRAMNGAIDRVEIDHGTLQVKIWVIGNEKPVGICGSGLICIVAELREAGIIDRSGKINLDLKNRRIRTNGGEMEYVLAFADEYGSEKDVAITENDIKNILRAKGAVFAGIRTMLKLVNLNMEDIERVFIAGGFGSFINITDAVDLGLLPELHLEKYKYAGNTSIHGAVMVMLSRSALEETNTISDGMTYLELSIGNVFMDEFISALFIPHTNLELFKAKP